MPASPLPQLDRPFLTDGGLETDVLFNRGIDLPHFSAITLLQSEEGRQVLRDYYRGFLELAARQSTGFVLESPTWRASPDWAEPLGLSLSRLDELNRDAVSLLSELRDEFTDRIADIVISGCIGPRGDGYHPGQVMTVECARQYHSRQIAILADARCDMVSAITMTNIPEAIGIVNAAGDQDMPVAVSFTVETDGRLPTGHTLQQAIAEVDAATAAVPAYYMVNCAHPDHFMPAIGNFAEAARIGGVRANASRCSHAELDAMTSLDRGDPAQLAALHQSLRKRHPQITVLGGCCGTDLEHVTAIAEVCFPR